LVEAIAMVPVRDLESRSFPGKSPNPSLAKGIQRDVSNQSPGHRFEISIISPAIAICLRHRSLCRSEDLSRERMEVRSDE